jgi:glycerol-3-phosphate acyltransferase PlsY
MSEPFSWSLDAPHFIGALVIGYLLGSIPFGLILTRFAGLGDIRAIGSGNIGATNVLRTGHKGLAAVTLIADALKGTVAVLICRSFGIEAAMVAGFAAFVGHVFPVWLQFKGGKGVATFLGVAIGLYWPSALVFAVAWILVALISRYSSLSALIASLLTPVALLVFGERPMAILFAVLALILWWRHAENIRRLLSGAEGKIGGSRG